MPKISIIIPCYYNEDNIPVTSRRLLQNEELFPEGVSFEYLMVDDGSQDKTYKRLLEFKAEFPEKVKVIKLASNVGSYNAIQAGMAYATGDCCCVMSCDLQDPPELIVRMYDYWEKGNKLILATRQDRHDSFLTTTMANFFHFLTKRFALKNHPKGGFDFVFFDKALCEELVKMKEKNTNSLMLLLWMGYDFITIPYVRQKREIGQSRWTLSKKIKLFIDSFVSFSFFPIRLISVTGLILGVISLLYAIFLLIAKLSGKIDVEGWTALMVVFLFISSFQTIALGIIGEYIWRTLDASRKRPIYIVENVI